LRGRSWSNWSLGSTSLTVALNPSFSLCRRRGQESELTLEVELLLHRREWFRGPVKYWIRQLGQFDRCNLLTHIITIFFFLFFLVIFILLLLLILLKLRFIRCCLSVGHSMLSAGSYVANKFKRELTDCSQSLCEWGWWVGWWGIHSSREREGLLTCSTRLLFISISIQECFIIIQIHD